MACRLQNLSSQPLTVDLRGGAALTLAPAQLSPPLRDEDLAGNVFIGDWQRRGWLARVPIKYDELLRHEGRWPEEPKAEEAPQDAQAPRAEDDATATDDGDDAAPAAEDDDPAPAKAH
jgi:hypothetical protein